MDGLALGTSPVNEFLQVGHRSRLFYSYFGGQVVNGRHETRPDDVFDVDVITDEPLAARVSIDDADETVALLAKEIEERTILTELVGIGRVVGGSLVMTEDDDEATAYFAAERTATLDVG